MTGTETKEFGFKVEGEFNDLQDFVDDAKKLDRDDGTLLCRHILGVRGVFIQGMGEFKPLIRTTRLLGRKI